MMRSKPAASMQKTYDECYLICSTAVFFEGQVNAPYMARRSRADSRIQNNEAEALRSWKSALDQINYHNAYRVSSSYIPRSETEKALYESLKQMELQCKERVDLLEALKQSREDASKEDFDQGGRSRKDRSRSYQGSHGQTGGWLADATIPPIQYSEIPNPSTSSSLRPPNTSRVSSNSVRDQVAAESRISSSPLAPAPRLPLPNPHKSRSPSPEHGKKTMRKTLRPEGRTAKTSRPTSAQSVKPAPMKAAGLAWDVHPRSNSIPVNKPEHDPTIEARLSATAARRSIDQARVDESRQDIYIRMPDPNDYISSNHWRDAANSGQSLSLSDDISKLSIGPDTAYARHHVAEPETFDIPPPTPPHAAPPSPSSAKSQRNPAPKITKPPQLSYRKEYPPTTSNVPPTIASNILDKAYNQKPQVEPSGKRIERKPLPRPTPSQSKSSNCRAVTTSDSDEQARKPAPRPKRAKPERKESTSNITPPSTDADSPDDLENPKSEFDKRAEALMRNLPKGIDELAAKNILNEIVVKGDEVHWDDVAGLTAAKKALKEAVVYPFLRPDLFMGLREPARGMLLFGPPGTGKTMLARAVATESKSTFFAISASSLTSKWHGESEKLVRALFGMAKALAPSIIFVDEIDSLLSSRGGGSEHEASRRSKTEFLIQWSDLQRAAAGKETSIGDPSRVLVLAATNCPWDIDEAARRRFVRRQYIPLPEAETRETQIRTLLGAQKHHLSDRDIKRLVRNTDGYSGSDITALAKDAAMGPLRNLGEALLFTPMDQIPPIQMSDFDASLINIRPSVGKKGLEEYDKWANEYGERGG